MTLLLVNHEDLLHFHTMEDARFWIDLHGDETDVVIFPDDEYDYEFQKFLDANAPVSVEKK